MESIGLDGLWQRCVGRRAKQAECTECTVLFVWARECVSVWGERNDGQSFGLGTEGRGAVSNAFVIRSLG